MVRYTYIFNIDYEISENIIICTVVSKYKKDTCRSKKNCSMLSRRINPFVNIKKKLYTI